MPQVTVILPTHNRIATLPRAVASVLAQQVDFELIVVDDASTDGTREWLMEQRDPRIRIMSTPRNLGPSSARNLALAEARAETTAFLNSDDEYLPGRLSVPIKILAGDSDVVCTLSSSEKHDQYRVQIALQPDVKLASTAFRWGGDLLGSRCSNVQHHRSNSRSTEDRRVLPEFDALRGHRIPLAGCDTWRSAACPRYSLAEILVLR